MPRLPETFRNIDMLDRELIYTLLQHKEFPCFSLMMPTYNAHPEKETNPIRFKNLVNELETKIQQNGLEKYSELISPLHQIEDDRDFWNHQESGLAVFVNPSFFKMIKVQIPLPELTIVADTFHIKPLYRYYQESGRFQVLLLGLDHVRLFEGNKYQLHELDLHHKVRTTMEKALGSELTDDHFNTASATGKGTNKQGNQGTGHVVHGYMEISREKEIDASRFFRIIDEKIDTHFSKSSGLPLILATLPEHQNLYRKLSNNKNLLKKGIEGGVNNILVEDLMEKAWEIYSLEHQKEIDAILEKQKLAESQYLSNSLLEDIALDAIDGKIDILLLEEGRIIKGRILEDERRIEYEPSGVDDLLDDLSAIVLEKSGRVILLPAEQMPHTSGAISINRF